MKTMTKRAKVISKALYPNVKPDDKAAVKAAQEKVYETPEAIGLLKKMPPTKFDQTVELSIRLGIDPKKSEQNIRGAISLPHGIGKSRKVIVFAAGDEAKQAKEAGADEVGAEELVKKVEAGWTDFDVAIAVPAMMKLVGKLGKVLGPQGKMPSPKTGTVTAEVAVVTKEYKAGKVEYQADPNGNIHAPVGKLSFTPEALEANINAFVDHLRAHRPASVKGEFIKRITLTSTMGPGLKITVKEKKAK